MQARLDELVAAFDRKMSAGDTVEAKLADLDRRMGAKLEAQNQVHKQAQDRAQDQALAP